MAQPLIIVESPTKARTLKRFLGDAYDVQASMGHVRDLPGNKLAVDIERGYEPVYEVVDSRLNTIRDLKRRSRGEVILASDPDREGEAIAWHLSEVLGLKNPRRIEFHEITRDAVTRALESPREIDMRRVNAQQARRVVDRLVGYKISPFLWSKVQRGIGAGRVQSVALRLVCDREREIREFQSVEHWSIEAELSKRPQGKHFTAKLVSRAGQKIELGDEASAREVLAGLEGAEYAVTGIERKRRTKSAPMPFITSTLQQEASSRLRFGPKRTMQVAQSLYEGVELGAEGPTGLITYMRTDSTRVSEEADARVQAWIRANLGAQYVGKPKSVRNRPGAQDAHEAIRPTDPARRPELVREYLTQEQFRLYQLIWQRFVASRMAPAVYDLTTVDIAAREYGFRATGSVLEFDGFYRVWERAGRGTERVEAADPEARRQEEEESGAELPALEVGERLRLHALTPAQHFTQPPPRYSEATLIRELEQRGIGRPSTYATIIDTIQSHGYVEQVERRLHPTPLGEAVNELMVDHFKPIVDDHYTAQMEKELDRVEHGRAEWVPVVDHFYRPLERMLSTAEEALAGDTGEVCPRCGEGHLVRRASRFGPFKGCSRYPECDYKEAIRLEREPGPAPELLDESCPECGRPLQKRKGRYGEFIGCSGYPQCRYIRREEAKARPTGEACPECGAALVEKQGRFGPYVACSNYPTCRYRPKAGRGEARPLDEKCPLCGRPMVERQGRFGTFKSCSGYPQCRGPKPAATGSPRGRRASARRPAATPQA